MTTPHHRAEHYVGGTSLPVAPPAPARRMPILAKVLIGLALFAMLAVCIGAVGSALSGAGDGGRTAGLTASTSEEPVGPGGVPAASRDQRPVALQPRNVKITLKTVSKECLGSAGCMVTVTPRLDWPTGQDSDGAYDVTYVISYQTLDFDGAGRRISGEETVGTAHILGGDQYESESHILMTASRKSKISVRVDQVERRG